MQRTRILTIPLNQYLIVFLIFGYIVYFSLVCFVYLVLYQYMQCTINVKPSKHFLMILKLSLHDDILIMDSYTLQI